MLTCSTSFMMKVVLLSLLAATATFFQQLDASELRKTQLPQTNTRYRAGETVNIVLESAWTVVFVQQGVNIDIDCLPWLRNFPGGQVTWLRMLEISHDVSDTTGVVSKGTLSA